MNVTLLQPSGGERMSRLFSSSKNDRRDRSDRQEGSFSLKQQKIVSSSQSSAALAAAAAAAGSTAPSDDVTSFNLSNAPNASQSGISLATGGLSSSALVAQAGAAIAGRSGVERTASVGQQQDSASVSTLLDLL